jgi:hypothetical protein
VGEGAGLGVRTRGEGGATRRPAAVRAGTGLKNGFGASPFSVNGSGTLTVSRPSREATEPIMRAAIGVPEDADVMVGLRGSTGTTSVLSFSSLKAM